MALDAMAGVSDNFAESAFSYAFPARDTLRVPATLRRIAVAVSSKSDIAWRISMAKDKDPNEREEAATEIESPADSEAAPADEIVRTITVEAPRPSRIGNGFAKSPNKIRYVN
ncbi:MAG TPA: hypothetical protein VIA18_00435 [Polyangia bacterium]|nr:hypothetical protein [Polyangia bacterium]